MKINAASVMLLCMIIALFSCKKDADDTPKQTDVYAAGFNNGKIVYWKNGVETTLATPDFIGMAYGMAVVGGDVYVAGGLNRNAVYWKNGIEVPLYNEPDGYKEATDIAVNGNDIYVTGIEVFNTTGQNVVLWKNGVKTILTSPNSTGTRASGIAVAGGDVYVSGNVGGMAVYWKNGVEHVLAGQSSETTGIAVSGTDVYVSGNEGSRAVYWKNGVKTVLTPLTNGVAKAILVAGSDLYIAGIIHGSQAVVWKNNIPSFLDPSLLAEATAIATDGKDIFIAGKIATATTTTAVYWQNGIKKEFATLANSPLQVATVNAIAVVTR